MTYPVELPLDRTECTGALTSFAASFGLFDLTDLRVELRNTDDQLVTTTLNGAGTYDYTVTSLPLDPLTSLYRSVVVSFYTAPPSGYKVGLSRAGTQAQTLDLTSGGALPAESLERRFDRLVSLMQDLQSQVNRAPLQPIGTALVIDGGGARISNVAAPIDDNDVLTKSSLITGIEIDFNTIAGVTVNSYAELRALAVGGSNALTAFTTGATSIGDGGDGFYYYDVNSAATDDGVTVIAPNSNVGRWLLDSATRRSRGVLRRMKPNTTARSNFATPFQDPDFIWFLDANTTYELTGFLHVSAGSAVPDFKFQFVPSAAVAGFALWASSMDPSGTQLQAMAIDISAQPTFALAALADTYIRLTGTVKTSAAIQFDFYWSQVTSSPLGVQVVEASWISLVHTPT